MAWDLFVYGTLRRGFCNHGWLGGAACCGTAKTAEAYGLYLEAGIPYLAADEARYPVVGEVYRVTDARTLAGLDAERVEDLGETGKKRKDADPRRDRSRGSSDRKPERRGERKSEAKGDRKPAAKSDRAEGTKSADDAPKRNRQRRRTRSGSTSAPVSPAE